MLWLLPKQGGAAWRRRYRRYAPDLLAEPFMRFLSHSALAWHFALGFALFGAGYLIGGGYTAVSWVVFGVFVRLVYVLHITWLVNSATHMWGYRRYETSDDSRNLWWLGLLSGGEGWHNNHHAFQRGARHGHRWWEVDTTYMTIWLMERFGLAWKVVRAVPAQVERATPGGG
jgi:fatty-acid desaturase